MAADSRIPGSPLSPFLCCAAITFALFVAGGFVFARQYREMLAIETTAGRLTHLDGVIMRLDETLTMSARMAAATGDPRWEQRYRHNEEPLDQAIAEALSLAPETASPSTKVTEAANAALVAIENRAFELSRQGKLGAAAAVFDQAYDEQKRIYAGGMDASMKAISRAVKQRIVRQQQTMIASVGIAAMVLVFLVLLWLRMMTSIRRYIRERGDAEAQLVSAHATLEARVDERTREVAASREQYRFLVENIDAVPFEWDPVTYNVLYIGPQAAKLFDCPLEALHDEALFTKVLHEDDRARVRERIDRFVETGGACTIDCRMVTNSRRTVTIRMFLSSRMPSQSSYGVMLDITQQAQLESEFQQSQKLESVGRLAAGVAHEINTPVQFVTDSVQFLRDSLDDVMAIIARHREATQQTLAGSPSVELACAAMAAEQDADMAYLSEQVPRALDRALDGLSRVATIVRSMKVFAHPDRKDQSPVDLNEAVASTITIARSEYKYIADLEPELGELPPVLCFAGDLNQVFLNLLINAAHAIGDAVAGTQQRGRITVTTRRDGNHVVIAIGDTGTGIPAAIRERVFDPFFTTKEIGKGTGQGLPHARSVIVDRHQGTLTFDTKEGVGTTFYIRIPIEGATTSKRAA
jgi:signal transduction histidine kinase